MLGWFACCTAAPAADSFGKDAGDVHVSPPAGSQPKQQAQHKTGWKHWTQQQADQLELSAKTAGAAPQKPGRISLRQRRKQHFSEPENTAAGEALPASLKTLSTSVPLTSRSLIAAATGCHSLSASASVQGYQRTAGAIRHQDTGDSPSEIHSELVQQQPKVLSICSTSCERTGEPPAGSVQSIASADEKQQQQQQDLQHAPPEQAPEQVAVTTIRVQTAQSSLSSMLLLESQQRQPQHFPSSNSCHATASSAGTAVLPVEAAVPLIQATVPPVQVVAAAEVAATVSKDTGIIQPTTNDTDVVAGRTAGTEAGTTSIGPAGTEAGSTIEQQEDISRTIAISTSRESGSLPPHVQLYRLESGTSFQMADPQLSSSSSIEHTTSSTMGISAISTQMQLAAGGSGSLTGPSTFPPSPAATPPRATASAVTLPSHSVALQENADLPTAAAAAAATMKQSSFVQLPGATKSPFAQLTLQQSVASALLCTQQQLQLQIQQRHSLPLIQQTFSSAQSFRSAPTAPALAAVAAAAGRDSSSGSLSTNPAAAAPATGAVMPLTPNSVTPRTTRISWAASSTAPAPESAVFDVLDPETASTDSGLRILKQSASATSLRHSASAASLSSLTGGFASNFSSSFSSRTAKAKLQQLRLAISMSWDQSGGATAAAAAVAAEPAARSGLKSILRRSTESLASASLKNTASAFRRSKSAHSNVMQHHSTAMASAAGHAGDAGSESDQTLTPAAVLTASSSSADLRCSLPPLPPAASGSGALAGAGSSTVTLGRAFTSAAVAGSVSSFATSGSVTTVAAAAANGLLSVSSSSSRLSSNAAAVQHLGHQSSASSGAASEGSLTQAVGSSSSLVALAVHRMHSAASSSNLGGPPSSTGSTSSTAGSTAGGAGLTSQGSTAALSTMGSNGGSTSSLAGQGSTTSAPTAAGVYNSSSSSVQVATAFAEAFLAALASGNTKWGSDVTVSNLLHETAKMLGMDKQLYTGRTAIIRRLNSGMDQLVKMVAANTPDGSTSAGGTAAIADLAGSMPKPVVNISCPDPKAKPSLAVATYTFKWGVRKFTLKDEFIVKQGQIMRLRRSRG